MQKKTINKNDKLFQTLLALSKKAIDKTLVFKDDGKLEAIPYQYIPVENIDYLSGTYNYDWNKLEDFDSYKWRNADLFDFMEKELNTLKEFEEAVQQVMEEFGVSEHAVKNGLSTLLHLIMEEAPNGGITYDNISSYVQFFIDGYESLRSHIPIVWNVHLWLGNTYIESDEIEIEQGVYLRRPTKEQLAYERPKPSHVSELQKMTGKVLGAGAILSFPVVAGNRPVIGGFYPEKITQEIERWLNAFRLFKPTDLTIIYQSVNPVSIFQYSTSENKDQPQDKYWQGKIEPKDTSNFKLYLKSDEEEIFRTFIKDVKPVLKKISHKTYLSGSSYELAFHRYNDSLVKTEVNAYKILSAITSLEALLSGGETEITFKIRMRVAKLLSLFGFDSLDVSKKVRDAYNLRSKLVHGSKPEDNKTDLLKFARKHTHEILNYNRICLLIALQVEKSINKQELIELVNNSFIDVATDIKLKKLINENVKIPIINPFKIYH